MTTPEFNLMIKGNRYAIPLSGTIKPDLNWELTYDGQTEKVNLAEEFVSPTGFKYLLVNFASYKLNQLTIRLPEGEEPTGWLQNLGYMDLVKMKYEDQTDFSRGVTQSTWMLDSLSKESQHALVGIFGDFNDITYYLRDDEIEKRVVRDLFLAGQFYGCKNLEFISSPLIIKDEMAGVDIIGGGYQLRRFAETKLAPAR